MVERATCVVLHFIPICKPGGNLRSILRDWNSAIVRGTICGAPPAQFIDHFHTLMSQAAAAASESVLSDHQSNPVSGLHPRSSRGFWFLIATQFQGAFNENGLKNLVVFIILATVAHQASRDRL